MIPSEVYPLSICTIYVVECEVVGVNYGDTYDPRWELINNDFDRILVRDRSIKCGILRAP